MHQLAHLNTICDDLPRLYFPVSGKFHIILDEQFCEVRDENSLHESRDTALEARGRDELVFGGSFADIGRELLDNVVAPVRC